MKTFNIVAVLLALLACPVATRAEEGKFAIGAQGGLTFPEFHVKDTTVRSLYGNKNGWLGGIFLEFGLWSITLRPELNYVTKGYTVAGVAEVKNQYLEVPVLLKISPLGKSVLSPFLVLGPQWSKQIGETVTTVVGVTTYNNTVTEWDISGVAGLGLEIDLSDNVGLNVQGRYSYGFRNVNTTAVDIRNRGFYALAGMTFQNAF